MSPSESADREHASTDLLQAVDRAIVFLQSHPDEAVREAARALLEGIDGVHRAGLTHLVQGIHAMAGESFLNRLTSDPAIRLLLMSYNLIAVDRRLQAEEALDAARGHLHDHGIDVEIIDVVGGVVYVRVYAPPGMPPANLPLDAIRRDLESTLLAGLVGFQELVIRGREDTDAPTQVVPLAALRRPHRPVYHEALALDELPPGAMRSAQVSGVTVLLANVDGEVYALRNQCGESPLPLEFGTLSGGEVQCPWHGCRYDIRSGRRLDAESGRIQVFPVAIDAGRIRIALDVEPNDASR